MTLARNSVKSNKANISCRSRSSIVSFLFSCSLDVPGGIRGGRGKVTATRKEPIDDGRDS